MIEALHRSLAHTSYHVGQIVYIAKEVRGRRVDVAEHPARGSPPPSTRIRPVRSPASTSRAWSTNGYGETNGDSYACARLPAFSGASSARLRHRRRVRQRVGQHAHAARHLQRILARRPRTSSRRRTPSIPSAGGWTRADPRVRAGRRRAACSCTPAPIASSRKLRAVGFVACQSCTSLGSSLRHDLDRAVLLERPRDLRRGVPVTTDA